MRGSFSQLSFFRTCHALGIEFLKPHAFLHEPSLEGATTILPMVPAREIRFHLALAAGKQPSFAARLLLTGNLIEPERREARIAGRFRMIRDSDEHQ
jgi:hypothetical protein